MQSVQSVVRVSESEGRIVARRFGAETLLVPVCAGVGELDNVYTLNAVGTTIWESLAHPTTPDDLAAALTAEYDVPGDRARADVEEFLADLGALGLLTRAAEGGAPRT